MTEAGPVRVAVVGRQNVGKSTLVNRLAGRRIAIAHETPGVTRDRVEVQARWGGRTLLLTDTGGFMQKARGIDASVTGQALRALEDADLILLVVETPGGIREEDAELAKRLRRSTKPVLVVANKVDGPSQEPLAAEFHALGLGSPLPVSALHGRGTGELLDRILDLSPESGEPLPEDEARLAIVGRPNVGKSSLFNRLVHQDRAVVDSEPGTTRDAVDTLVDWDGRSIRFIDTAGLRRMVKTQGIEYYGLLRSVRAMEASHVAVLVMDSAQGVTGEDRRLAARVAEAGRGLCAVLNKWDLVPKGEREGRFLELREGLGIVPGTPVLRTSALTGAGVGKVLPAALAVHEAWGRRVSTGEVNRVLRSAVDANPPPRRTGRVLYGTQVSAGPPHLVLFGLGDPGGSYRRYLENSLRQAFGFDGVPVRLSFRSRRARPSPSRPTARRPARAGR